MIRKAHACGVKGWLIGLRGCGKGRSIGLQFFEHFTFQGAAGQDGDRARFRKAGVGCLAVPENCIKAC